MIQKLFLFVISLFSNFSTSKRTLLYTFLFIALGLKSGYGQSCVSNLISNGNFSSSATNWTYATSFGFKVEVNPENTYFTTSNSNSTAELDTEASLRQVITVVPGISYTVSFLYGRRPGAPATSGVTVKIIDGATAIISPNLTTTSTIPQVGSFTFTPTSSSIGVEFYNTLHGNSSLGTIIDDIVLVPTSQVVPRATTTPKGTFNTSTSCPGVPVQLDVDNIIASGVTYAWTGSAGAVFSPSANIKNPTITFTGSGIQQATVIATSAGGCSNSSTTYVNVYALPTAYAVTGGGSYCSGGTGVVVGLASSASGINYQLQIGGVNTGSAVAGTGSAISFGLKTAAGIYTVVATNATTTCTSNMAGSVAVLITVPPTITSNKVDETCPVSNNGSISPILSGGISNVKYIKITQKYANSQQVAEIEAFEIFTGTNVARSTNGAIATSSSNYNATLTPGKAIDGDITGINNNYWHSLTGNVNEWIMVTLPANKNIDFLKIYNRMDCCSDRGQNMLLELLDDSGNVLYSKTIDLYQSGANVPVNVNVLDVSWSDSATTLNRTNLDSGTYTLNYADANTCSTNLPVIISSINANPTITTQPSASSQPYCLNSPASALAVTATGTNITYQWYINATASNTGGTLLSGATSANYTPLTTSTGTNYYYCVVSGTCTPAATSSVSGGITVTSLPAAPNVSVTTAPTCVTNTGTITISAPLGAGFTYSIDGATYTNTTGEFTAVPVGNYNITAKNSTGCISPATPIDVNSAVTKTWTGVSGTNWNDATNWNPNGVPISSDCVVVPNTTNKPILSGTNANFYANTLQVDANAIITVQPTNTLSVINTVTVATNGQLIFENNASLVQTNNVTNTGNIIYKRNSAPMKNFDYTYWSSPVAGQTLFDLSPNTLADKYMSYSGTGWQISYGGTAVMQPGIGYIIRTPKGGTWPAPHPEVVAFPYSQPVQFKGVPNNGNITSGQSMVTGNFYLIGNPYPSALFADDFLSDNNTVLNGTIYLWTHNTAITSLKYTSDDYASYNALGGVTATSGGSEPLGYIAAGQSFFASAKDNGNAEFNNSMRPIGNNAQFFKPGKTAKAAKLERHRLWLNMTNTSGAFKQTLIGYAEGATNTYDDNFDGLTFDGNSYLDLYSINGTDNLTIQGRALPFTDTDIVPLGYRSTVAGSFTIAINKADGVLANQRVYLEDKQTGTINELTVQNYTFNTAIGTFNNRFVLRYTNKTLGTGDFETVENQITVVSQDKTITISSPTENIDKVFIYDVSGKLLYKKQNVGNLELSIQNLAFAQQVLLVKVVLENGYTTTKKLIFK